jgi:hypothetical protein
VNVTGIQGNRYTLHPVITQYLPAEIAEPLLRFHEWTVEQIQDVITRLEVGRPAKAQRDAVALLRALATRAGVSLPGATVRSNSRVINKGIRDVDSHLLRLARKRAIDGSNEYMLALLQGVKPTGKSRFLTVGDRSMLNSFLGFEQGVFVGFDWIPREITERNCDRLSKAPADGLNPCLNSDKGFVADKLS